MSAIRLCDELYLPTVPALASGASGVGNQGERRRVTTIEYERIFPWRLVRISADDGVRITLSACTGSVRVTVQNVKWPAIRISLPIDRVNTFLTGVYVNVEFDLLGALVGYAQKVVEPSYGVTIDAVEGQLKGSSICRTHVLRYVGIVVAVVLVTG